MAFGKADTGLIQADRAAQTMDPMLGVSMGIGNMLGGIKQTYQANQAAMAKAANKRGEKWDKITTELMGANNNLPKEQRRDLKQLFRTYKQQYVNAADSADMDEIYDNFEREANITNQVAADVNASRDNGNNYGPGFDNSDIYFSTAFSNNEGERVTKTLANGDKVQLLRIKNEEGYDGGPDSDGYTYFPLDALPVGMDQWNDGSAAVIGTWNEQITSRKDFSTVMSASEFAKTFKSSLPEKMSYFQGQDLIAADHSKDGKDNSFIKEFVSGNLPPEFYQSINTGEKGAYITIKRADGTEVSYDPSKNTKEDKRGGLTEEELTDWIKGKNFNGVKDYTKMADINMFIKEKYSDFMGIVTKEAYDAEQKKKLEANNKYFNAPNEDGSFSPFMNEEGEFVDVTTKKQDTLKDFKFASATSFNMMRKTGEGMEDVEQVQVDDWNQVRDWSSQITEDGDFVKNLQANYNYDDVSISAEDGVLSIDIGTGNDVVNETYDFNSDRDKNLLLDEMKNHLSRSKFNNFSELTTLGNDATKWNDKIKADNTLILQQLSKEQIEKDKVKNLDRTSKEWSKLILESEQIQTQEDVLQAYSTRLGKEFTTVEEYFNEYMKVDNPLFPRTASQFNKMWEAKTGVNPNME